MTRSTLATPLARRTMLRAALMASAALGVGLLSACGAGQITQTDTQVPAVPGVNVNSTDGQIALRDGLVTYADEYKPGSTVPISVRLFNNSHQTAKLTGVTSDSGTFVLVGQGSASSAAAAAAPAPSSSAPASASATPSGSKKPSGSAPASGGASVPASPSASALAAPAPTSAGTAKISVNLPVSGFAVLSRDTETYLAVDRLTGSALRAGDALKNVVFTFTYADGTTTTITLPELPMTPPLTPLPKPSPVVPNGGE
ncbi:hypothetical protein [Dactylosporangium sp. CA-092794]|uniref:hypothetical protein n=1 Tax=Dactylosporangium sp. CA-092794 TaxID=3239929 RepID=UPI003D94CD6F